MARATINQGANETAVADAANRAVAGETAALSRLSRLPAAAQLEAHLRYVDRVQAGEGRTDAVVTPPLAPGSN
jgi:hypothetical protein